MTNIYNVQTLTSIPVALQDFLQKHYSRSSYWRLWLLYFAAFEWPSNFLRSYYPKVLDHNQYGIG